MNQSKLTNSVKILLSKQRSKELTERNQQKKLVFLTDFDDLLQLSPIRFFNQRLALTQIADDYRFFMQLDRIIRCI